MSGAGSGSGGRAVVSDPLPSQRHLFDLPAEVAYLDCAYMSPQLRAVTAAGLAAVRRKAAPWTTEWFTEAEALRGAAARLMGAEADGVALVPAASYGIAIAAANLPVHRGQNVVVLAGSVLTADRRVGHLVGLRFPGGLPPALPARLAEAGVHVSVRGDSIRVAPHVYNGEDDVERLLAVLRAGA